jgi:hypothetical protein
MKVCNRCGEEIATKDGDNLCSACKRLPIRKVKLLRREREDMLSSLGLVKAKGKLGGTYWE